MTFRTARLAAALSILCSAAPAVAEESSNAGQAGPSAGVELWISTDSDDTDVVKLLGKASWRDEGPDQYQGIAIEKAWFRPQGQKARTDLRLYADFAGSAGKMGVWKTRLGSDGHSWLGSASLRARDWSKEIFVEREIVETPRGVDERIYYTFIGASADLVSGPRHTLNASVALQEFTGRNERLHVRASYVHVIKPELGLSLQLRGRYFHSTAPGEFDYYSPGDFVQALPVVQMRRFTASGWMVLGAVGLGLQRATGSSWQSSRLLDLRVESPPSARKVRAFGQVQYSNSSISKSGDYHYWLARLGLSAGL